MRKWGVVISVTYAVILLLLIVPGAARLGSTEPDYRNWSLWVLIGVLLAGQALLLFLSVDTSFRRNKPRAHIAVSCLVAGAMLALLAGAAFFSLGFGIYGDNFDHFLPGTGMVVISWAAIWVVWALVFYLFWRDSAAVVTRATSWLLKGSVLELLIAVPAHVVARRRHDCSAPAVTSFGISAGIAIMLLSFGPSVLLLYKKKIDEYDRHKKSRVDAASAK